MELSRRNMLQLAGLAAAGTTLGNVVPTAARAAGPPWDDLRVALTGNLFVDGDSGYDSVRLPFNQVYADRRPDAIAKAAHPSDIQACFDFAISNDLPIAARSGGHSYTAYSTPQDALVVDLEQMADITVAGDGTATIGSGARLINVYAELANHGRALPGGTCPTVGIAGLTLGGGLGVLMRKHGLTCDRLASASVITPDSVLRTADATSETDLYWALRGGGGGNFGITSSFTFNTVPAPETVTVFTATFPTGSGADVFGAWQDWITTSPRELWSNISLVGGPSPSATVPGCLLGTESQARALIANLESAAGVQTSEIELHVKDYLGAMLFWAGCTDAAGCTTGDGGQVERRTFVAASRVLSDKVSDPTALTDLITGDTTVALEVNPLDGAVADPAATDTAFVHREAFGDVQVYAGLEAGADTGAARDEVDNIQRELAAIATGGAYVNYLFDRQEDWASAYYGQNLPRLKKIAQHYDPDGVLAFDQGLANREER